MEELKGGEGVRLEMGLGTYQAVGCPLGHVRKPLNGLWQAGLCLGISGCRKTAGALFLIMASLAFALCIYPLSLEH